MTGGFNVLVMFFGAEMSMLIGSTIVILSGRLPLPPERNRLIKILAAMVLITCSTGLLENLWRTFQRQESALPLAIGACIGVALVQPYVRSLNWIHQHYRSKKEKTC